MALYMALYMALPTVRPTLSALIDPNILLYCPLPRAVLYMYQTEFPWYETFPKCFVVRTLFHCTVATDENWRHGNVPTDNVYRKHLFKINLPI